MRCLSRGAAALAALAAVPALCALFATPSQALSVIHGGPSPRSGAYDSRWIGVSPWASMACRCVTTP